MGKKKQTRPFRKMGHVTIVNEDMKIARKNCRRSEEKSVLES
jgi:phosphoribosylaminoimidazole carboxylase (NCAIR synthetase)